MMGNTLCRLETADVALDRLAGLGVFSAGRLPAYQEPAIDREVDRDDRSGERKLDLPGKAGRVDDREQIVLDKALRIAGLARLDAQVVLQQGERADAAANFYPGSPCRRRKMNDDYPAPPNREHGSQQRKDDERQMG
jgi:hypothetical protein